MIKFKADPYHRHGMLTYLAWLKLTIIKAVTEYGFRSEHDHLQRSKTQAYHGSDEESEWIFILDFLEGFVPYFLVPQL